MAHSFDGKVVLVTGGGAGIGRAIAQSFGAAGAWTYLFGRRPAELDRVAGEINAAGGTARAIVGDVSVTADVQRALDGIKKERGFADVVVNAAGRLCVGAVGEVSEEDFDETVATNLRGLWLVSKLSVPLLRGREGANIINISSVAALRNETGLGIFEATKAAVNTLTKVMAKELARERIRVNAIAPGPINTEIFRGSPFGDDMDTPQPREVPATPTTFPFGRLGTPGEVARLAMFLASPESDFISGSITTIDGGMGY